MCKRICKIICEQCELPTNMINLPGRLSIVSYLTFALFLSHTIQNSNVMPLSLTIFKA